MFKWLAYSDLKKGGFCKYCVIFQPTGGGQGCQVIINYYKIKMILIILIITNMFQQLLRTFSQLISTYSIFYLSILKHIFSKIRVFQELNSEWYLLTRYQYLNIWYYLSNGFVYNYLTLTSCKFS